MSIRRLGLAGLALVLSAALSGTFSTTALAGAPETPETRPASEITATTAKLSGVLNPNAAGEVGEYEFFYEPSESECGEAGTAPAPAAGLEKEEVSANLTGLQPGTHYVFCLFARNIAGETATGTAMAFTTSPAAPTIVSGYTSKVLPTSANLGAEINPEGSETTYHFDYGTTSAYGLSTNESASIGADNSDHVAAVPVQGLQPGTVYHYRVVATNSQSPAGGTLGPDHAFTTSPADGQSPGPAQSEKCTNEQLRAEQPYGLGLPDCRAYEMVSPIEKDDNRRHRGRFGGLSFRQVSRIGRRFRVRRSFMNRLVLSLGRWARVFVTRISRGAGRVAGRRGRSRLRTWRSKMMWVDFLNLSKTRFSHRNSRRVW